ncbi:hypothetical protein V5O48_007417 [Marasmius crinis-equi]|uniref:ABC transporter domain-containing protein n=1 Tax=Marasmius crinis-equi TaxID=585013 RepID=A0ABR3FGR1_9AGAR
MGQPVLDKDDNKQQESTETETLYLGIYRVICKKKESWFKSYTFNYEQLRRLQEGWVSGWMLLQRLVLEIISLRPRLFAMLVVLNVWDNMQNVLLLSLETRILQAIETGLSKQSVDTYEVAKALATRVICVVASSFIARRCRNIQPNLEAAVKHHYDDLILKTKLAMDLPMLQDNIKYDRISSETPWETTESVVELFARIAALVGQMGLVLSVARSGNHGIIFAFLCMARPILSTLTTDTLWSRPRVVQVNNGDYLRMAALQGLSDKKYRHDILSGGIVQYIIQEFKKARTALGDVPVRDAEDQYEEENFNQILDALTALSGDLPMLYYALVVLLRPSLMSLSTIATLQQSSTLLRWSFYDIYYELSGLRHKVSDLRELYELENLTKVVKDGDQPYPNEKESPEGMSLALKNVTFSYPSEKSEKKALDDVSFCINPGQLVVIVGTNGSGKSTFINLLTRMYDVSSGQVLVDGEDIRNLKMSDFRQATATLTQDHQLFPLSIAENIGLGCPEYVNDKEKILDAAKKGGCEALVKKLDSGFDTVLDHVGLQYFSMVDRTKGDELSKAADNLDKTADVSGGERQRLVAARTFMRFRSNKIKFVAVDEPSSALDPQGELDLFNNLRAARDGKTMLFVTHRFGPLTKHADQIICMKDGKVAEFGTHMELMLKEGEYCTMYNIQANAFEKGGEA